MPPTVLSRYRTSYATRDAKNRLFLSDRERLRYRDDPDNTSYTVKAGDTLFTVAELSLRGIVANPSVRYWILADYQPDPVIDPMNTLTPGTEVVIPPARLVRELLRRRRS